MYKLNNKATITYNNGKMEEIEYSYVSYEGGGGSLFSSGEKFIKFHGRQGGPYIILAMGDMKRIILTDNEPEKELEPAPDQQEGEAA